MKKSELKNRMVVKTRNGKLYMVIDEMLVSMSGYFYFSNYNEDMTEVSGKYAIFDIVEVYDECFTIDLEKYVKSYNPIWRRKEEPIEVTMTDIEEKFGHPVKIVKEGKETLRPWIPSFTNEEWNAMMHCCCNN